MNTISLLLLLLLLLLTIINKSGKERYILIVAFLLRLTILLLDYYHVIDIPFAGGDTELFNSFALSKMAGHEIHYTHYTDFLVFIYSLTGASRFFAQGINVAFSYSTLLIVSKTTNYMGISQKHQLRALALVAFMPSIVAFSGILLREAWVEFFLSLSVFYFVKWYKKGRILDIVFCFVSALLAVYMHDGTIGVLFGYSIAFVLYNRRIGKESISARTLLSLAVLLVIGVFVANYYGIILNKFVKLTDQNLLESEIGLNRGGSAYLQWMQGYPFMLALLLSPIRMFYFLFSPIPFDWRGLTDIAVFVVDSLVYMYLLWVSCRKLRVANMLRKYFLIAFLCTTLIFSMGTSNSGTAIRHRAKSYPLLVLTYSLAVKERNSSHIKRISIY